MMMIILSYCLVVEENKDIDDDTAQYEEEKALISKSEMNIFSDHCCHVR
jgi:hypothetical protein